MSPMDARRSQTVSTRRLLLRAGTLGAGILGLGALMACGSNSSKAGNSATAMAADGSRPAIAAGNDQYTIDPAQAEVTGGAADPRQGRWLTQATAFMAKPEQQRDVQVALRARASTHPAYCPSASFAPKRIDIAFDPEPQFAPDGTLTRGTIVYRATMQGCSMPVLLTVYVDAAPGTPLHFRVGVPGTTFADPDLQEQAIPQAIAAARPLLPGCGRPVPIDTRLIGASPSASGALAPWSEYWLVAGCGRKVSVKLDFTPDPASNRMVVRADPGASRPLQTDAGGALSTGATADASRPPSTPGQGGGRIVASAIGTSAIPLGGADIPGAKVAGTCLLKLCESAGAAPDGVECLAGLPAREGGKTSCSASRGKVHGQMQVAITEVDRTNGSVKFQCVVRAP